MFQMNWPAALVLSVATAVSGVLVFKGILPLHYVLIAAAWLVKSPLSNGGFDVFSMAKSLVPAPTPPADPKQPQ